MRNTNMTGRRPSDGYVKSTFSDQGGQCVLVRRMEGDPSVFIRDSKYQRGLHNRTDNEPILEMPASAWAMFEASVLNQAVIEPVADQPRIEEIGNGDVALHGADGTTLAFTEGEWDAFRAGLAAGEFEPRSAAA